MSSRMTAPADSGMSAPNSKYPAPVPLTGTSRSRSVDEPELEQLSRGVERSCDLLSRGSHPAATSDQLRVHSEPRRVKKDVRDQEHPLMLHLRRIGSEWQVCKS
eukprot:scaffold15240_cov128-Isochrysis_galbana.AAC.8